MSYLFYFIYGAAIVSLVFAVSGDPFIPLVLLGGLLGVVFKKLDDKNDR